MNVIVAGAGRVGLAAAAVAARNGDVLVMDKDTSKAEIAKAAGFSILHNDASNPKNLEYAISRFNPEIIISAVNEDSVNVFIGSLVKRTHPAIRTIATIKDDDFLELDGTNGVDSVIAPRRGTAERISETTLLENAVYFSHISGSLFSAVFKINKKSDLVGKYVMDQDNSEGEIIAIYRGDQTITTVYAEEIHYDDRILTIGSYAYIKKFNDSVGGSRTVRNITIIGASPVGISVASKIINAPGRHIVKIIDSDLELCNNASRLLRGVVIINGNIADPVFLRSENVDRADAVIAVSDSEETNLLVCINAMRFGINKIITQYTTEEYGELLRYSGVECLVGYHNVITNETSSNLMASHAHADGSYVFNRPGEYLLYFDIDESYPFLNKPMGDIYFSKKFRLVAIMRGKESIFPKITDRFEPNDRLFFYTSEYDPVSFSHIVGRPFSGL